MKKVETRDNRPGLSNALWVQDIIDNYSSVNETIAHLGTYQIVSKVVIGLEWPTHACLEDST